VERGREEKRKRRGKKRRGGSLVFCPRKRKEKSAPMVSTTNLQQTVA